MSNRSEKTVLFLSKIAEPIQEYLLTNMNKYTNLKLLFPSDTSNKSILSLVPDADALIGWRPTRTMLKKAVKLKMFINPGAGVTHLIDLFREVNQEREVKLINGHGNSYFVAQHAVALLLTFMNKTILHHQWMKQGKWRTGDKEATSIPLRFRKVGLLGYGAINNKIHKMLQGFNIEFSILRKHWDKQNEQLITPINKFSQNQVNEFCDEIDILIVAIPLTSKTEDLIGKEQLNRLGKEGIIINVGRGKIINEKALYNTLRDKTIAGAAIDVWYNYTPEEEKDGKKYPYNYPFHDLDNIILSPHRGYSPFIDLLRWDEVIENLSRLSKNRNDFINQVNL
ncbi:MAG: NAD(P)-dependent oxidoreductase, partial [Promethearchaeota archaeon]